MSKVELNTRRKRMMHEIMIVSELEPFWIIRTLCREGFIGCVCSGVKRNADKGSYGIRSCVRLTDLFTASMICENMDSIVG